MKMFPGVLALALTVGVVFAPPAFARRTVIDGGTTFSVGGYCSATTSGSADCVAQTLGFTLVLDGQSYDNFYINSNGVLSLGSIQGQLISSITNPLSSLAGLSVPVFSPRFYDGLGSSYSEGQYVARVVSSTSNLLQVAFFECSDPLRCGRETVERNLGFAPSFYLTLQSIAGGGFSLAYNYDTALLGTQGTSGFNLPSTGLVQTTGPLQNQSFLFGANGQLMAPVPEPSTWLMMLVGFALVGGGLRRNAHKATATRLA
jgi:hypothetical protein